MALFLVPSTGAETTLIGGREHIHLNMKEASDLSPETWGDNTREAVKDNPPRSWSSQTADFTRTREWKDVGTWTTANTNAFDLGLGGPVKFNLWWRETDQGQDDSYDAQVQYRFRLNIDGQEAAYYTDEGEGSHECAQSQPCEWNGQVNNINITSAPKGTIFDIEIEYWAFSDIEIYYDNASFNSGVAFGADAIKFGQSGINGQQVSFDFVQAWDTDAEEAVNGDYIRLVVDGIGTNSSQQRNGYPIVSEGLDYDINGTSITSTKVTWYIDDKYATLDKSVISFSLTRRSCDTAPPIDINTADIIAASSGSGDDEGGLPVPGFNFILVIFALFGLAYSKREV
tara:strand:- start:947 stop:1972 length:1026 start_codon:yes stop_codon:yes gene_type:complete